MREVMFQPFERPTGIRVRDDGPPEAAKVKAMVESGNVTWDILDTDIPAILTMAKNNLLEKIDYGRLDKARLDKIPPVLHHPYGIGHLIYSFNIVYNTKTFPTGKHPQSWADVWDGQKFKGARSFPFRGGISPQLELAVVADGVPTDKVYPARRRAGMEGHGSPASAGDEMVRKSRRSYPALLLGRGRHLLHHWSARPRCEKRGRRD